MKQIAIALLAVLALIGGLCFVGCETESASQNNLRITPASAIILIDQSIELTAKDGFDYEWSLEHEDWGTLSTTIGPRTVYTSAYDPAAETWQEHQVITVTSYINRQAAKTNGTDTTSYAQTAEAIITHQTAQVVVQISPPNAAVNEFGSVTFTASGANIYNWSLKYPSWGQLTSSQGATTTYTSTFAPNNGEHIQILTCSTDRGSSTAHIIHNPEGLTVSPSSAVISASGSQAFTVTGGDASATYSWSLSPNDGFASFSPASGSATVVSGNNTDTVNKSYVLKATSGSDSASAVITVAPPTTTP